MADQKILVVDDEPFIVEFIMINLVKAGFLVVTASDGEEAWEKVQKEKPDLIVSDVNMPRLDGFGLLKRLKAQMSTRRIPVVMLTARTQDQDVFQGWKIGADEYITKPFNPQQLIFIIKKIFQDRAEEIRKDMEGKYVIE